MPTSPTPGNQHPHVHETRSPEGLRLLNLEGSFGSAQFAPQGAHLLQYTPKDSLPFLFLSSNTHLAPGKAIRGGVPVIFPWFGPRVGHPESPMHGIVRTREWTVDQIDVPEIGPATARFSLQSSEETLSLWPHAFSLTLEFRLGPALDIHWEVQNTGDQPFTFEQALHPYFSVKNIHAASLKGLGGSLYIDKTDSFTRKTEGSDVLFFSSETDRLYLNTTSECVLNDRAGGRRLVISKTGSFSSVAWNPWITKAAALEDLGDTEWEHFVCIEQANAADNAITLPPGSSHLMTAHYDFSNPLQG